MSTTLITAPEDWFVEWFNEKYLDVYSHRDETEARRFIAELPIWKDLSPNGWCLDLGCGEGRYSREIACKGLNVMGLDLSRPLLRKAFREKIHSGSVRFVRADMRNIPAKGRFVLIVNLFTSFGYFDNKDNIKLLENIRSLLLPEGVFILDLANPMFVEAAISDKPVTIRDKSGMYIREERYFDSENSRVIKRIEIESDGKKHKYYESVRLYYPKEMDGIMKECCFKQIHPVWGDYEGGSFTENSPRMVYFMGV